MKLPKDEDRLPDAEAEARFKRIVGNLVNTPHKPQAPRKDAQRRRQIWKRHDDRFHTAMGVASSARPRHRRDLTWRVVRGSSSLLPRQGAFEALPEGVGTQYQICIKDV